MSSPQGTHGSQRIADGVEKKMEGIACLANSAHRFFFFPRFSSLFQSFAVILMECDIYPGLYTYIYIYSLYPGSRQPAGKYLCSGNSPPPRGQSNLGVSHRSSCAFASVAWQPRSSVIGMIIPMEED